jgi:hypothetical protein
MWVSKQAWRLLLVQVQHYKNERKRKDRSGTGPFPSIVMTTFEPDCAASPRLRRCRASDSTDAAEHRLRHGCPRSIANSIPVIVNSKVEEHTSAHGTVDGVGAAT